MITYISMVIIIGMIGFFENDFHIGFMIYGYIGFDPATCRYIFFAYAVHHSTNWAIDGLSYFVLRNEYICI